MQPEELTLLLIKLRRQQAELNSLREHTVAQLMALGMEGPNAKVSTECVHMCLCVRVCVHARKYVSPSNKQSKNLHALFVFFVCLQAKAPWVRPFIANVIGLSVICRFL